MQIPRQAWVYRARPLGMGNSITVDVTIDTGFRSFRDERLRLSGVDVAETKGPTRAMGKAAKSYILAWLAHAAARRPLDDWTLVIETEESDVHGQFLATIWRMSDGACLNDDLVAAGHARADVRAMPPKLRTIKSGEGQEP